MKTAYTVSVSTVLAAQYDERYSHEIQASSPVAGFETLEAAHEYAAAYDLAPAEVTHTRRGLDTVEYEQVEVWHDTFDQSGDVEETEFVESRDSLTPEIVSAMEQHEREYHEFLDYKRPYYRSINDLLNA